MLSDNELIRLRQLWTDACIAPVHTRGNKLFPSWDSMVVDPSEKTIRAFFHDPDTPVEINMAVFDCVASIGMAVAPDVLNGAPLDLNFNSDRRWQLRRELSKLVAGMTQTQLQQVVYWARSIANV